MPKPTPPKVRTNIEFEKQSVPNANKRKASMKETINGEHPINGVKRISTRVCKNLACKAVVPSEDSFCKRCSCCICHRFDDKKDPTLWLVCASENDGKNCCGSSCHIECLLQDKRVGCFDIEKIIHLDGSFSCAACGRISGILGYLKRQLVIGKDARRLDNLCHRIYLIYRLLEGTRRFKELHVIIEDAKEKLESEVGPLDGMSAKMARDIVRRSSVGIDVQKLCSIALQKADDCLSSPDLYLRDSLPAACRFRFVDIKSSSLTIILKETSSSDTIKGYKLWYWKSREHPSMEEPAIVPKDQRKILVFNLSPCTEYSFRVVSFTNVGILGHSEFRCFTGSKEIFFKRPTQNTAVGGSRMEKRDRNESFKSKGFKIRDIWKTFQERLAEEGCFVCKNMQEGSCSRSATEAEQPGNSEQELLSHAFGQHHATDCAMDCATEKLYYHSKKRLVRSNDSCDSETCAVGQTAEPPAVESRPDGKLRQLSNGCEQEDAFANGCEQEDAFAICCGKQISGTRQLSEDYEHCIKVIRQLECDGHIKSDFRKNFLGWYSVRATGQESRAVTTFIKTLGEEPSALADQLVDCFGEIVNCKKPKAGFCDKLWH